LGLGAKIVAQIATVHLSAGVRVCYMYCTLRLIVIFFCSLVFFISYTAGFRYSVGSCLQAWMWLRCWLLRVLPSAFKNASSWLKSGIFFAETVQMRVSKGADRDEWGGGSLEMSRKGV